MKSYLDFRAIAWFLDSLTPELEKFNAILARSKREKEVITIRFDDAGEDSTVGFVEHYNNEILQLRCIDRRGLDDGASIHQTQFIKTIEYDSDYEKAYNFLARENHVLDRLPPAADFMNSANWRVDYLGQAKARSIAIAVELNRQRTLCGYVAELDDNQFVLDGLGRLGSPTGKAVHKVADISALHIQDLECQLRMKLHRWRQSPKP